MPQNSSLEAVLSFVNANNWSESKDIVVQNKDLLLTDEADAVFAHLLTQYADNPNATRLLTQHRDLLQRCRTEGIEAAFAPLMTASPAERLDRLLPLLDALLQCDSPRAVIELVAEHPELLSDEMDAFLRQNIAAAQGTDEGEAYAQYVAARLSVLHQMRQATPGERAGVRAVTYEEVSDAVLAFMNAKNWPERKEIVEKEKNMLLTDAALVVFADLLEQYEEDANATRLLTQRRDLLQRCRTEGIEAAFAPLMSD